MDKSPKSLIRSPVFRNIGRINSSGLCKRKCVNPEIQRLATPKPKDNRWLPDRPSVYWLDYIVDPTPHKIKDTEELASYYENFEPRFPRTKLLSAPRHNYGALHREQEEARSRPSSISTNAGIPVSALTYVATDRIKELARPKTTASANNNFPGTSFPELLRPITSKKAFSPSLAPKVPLPPSVGPSLPSTKSPLPLAKRYTVKEAISCFEPTLDLAGGDFSSKSKHPMHLYSPSYNNSYTNMAVRPSARARSSTDKPRSRSSLSNLKTEGVITSENLGTNKKLRRPMCRTLYSVRQ